jgi:hypothetical protein
MFSLIDYKPEHAMKILAYGAKEPGLELNDESIEFINTATSKGPCITGWFDGESVACGGIMIVHPGRGEMWMVNVRDIAKYHINPALAKEWMYRKMAEYNIVRLEAPLKVNFPEGVLYAEWLGFEFEGRLEYYHKDGSDALMYKIINRENRKGE